MRGCFDLDSTGTINFESAIMAFAKSDPLNFTKFINAVAIEDREQLKKAVQRALAEGGELESEYRIVRPGRQTGSKLGQV